jgi:hypothetical protein
LGLAGPANGAGEPERGLAGTTVIADTDGYLPDGDNDLALVLEDRTIGSDGNFADHLGHVLEHHHVLEHEDAGTMRNFLVT